jgi:hypothetical protein
MHISVLTLRDVYLDNTLLCELDDGCHTLNTDANANEFYFCWFPEVKDFCSDVDCDGLEEEGYRFERFQGFFPPKVVIHGTSFWLVGRYIICSVTEIDAVGGFIPEGVKIIEFPELAQVQAAFAKLVGAEQLIKRLVLHYCICGEPYSDHFDLNGNEVGCCREGCGCRKFTEDKRPPLVEE